MQIIILIVLAIIAICLCAFAVWAACSVGFVQACFISLAFL